MARNERAQWARLDIEGVALLADLAAGASLARVLDFQRPQLRCFGAPPASSVPLEVGTSTAAWCAAPAATAATVTLTPHANGTHTESVGHLTVERVDVHSLVPQRLLLTSC